MEKIPLCQKFMKRWAAVAGSADWHAGRPRLCSLLGSGQTVTPVKFLENGYSSNDNATLWQHYPGYPILAVMMMQGSAEDSWRTFVLVSGSWTGNSWTQSIKTIWQSDRGISWTVFGSDPQSDWGWSGMRVSSAGIHGTDDQRQPRAEEPAVNAYLSYQQNYSDTICQIILD